MPKLPRAEQTQVAQAVRMPFSSGDGYQAPGRAQEQLGRAIGQLGQGIASLGGAFDQQADQENDFKDKLAMLQFSNDVDMNELRTRADYNGDGANYAQDRSLFYQDRSADLLSRISPKGQQRASLFLEQKRGSFVEGATRFEIEKRQQTLFTTAESTLSSEAGKLLQKYADPEKFDPTQFETDFKAVLQGHEAIINSHPGGDNVKDRLREHSAKQLKGILDAAPAGRELPAKQKLLDEMLRLQPQGQPAAPVSNIQGQMRRVGSVSAKYESGGRGVGFISTGRGDPGGQSYGIHQLSTKDSMGAFLRSAEGRAYAGQFHGMRPGTPQFNEVYRAIAAKDPEGFANAQHAFYSRTHYQPVLAHAKALGFTTEDRGVQEALFSMGVQHGGAKKIVSAAKAAAGANPADQIRALYVARAQYVERIDLPAQTKASVLNRYRSEVNDALRYAGTRDAAPQQAANENRPSEGHSTPENRPMNTLPAAGGSPVRVADASGGVPQQRTSGSVAGKLVENITREMPAVIQRHRMAIGNLVDEVEKSAKEGFAHPQTERIMGMVGQLKDPALTQRMNNIMAGLQVTQVTRQMRPDQVNALAQAARAELGPTATPDQIARVKLIEQQSGVMNEQLAKDRFAWAVKAQVIPAPKLLQPETMSVEGLQERALLARQVAQHYGLPVEFFQPEEVARLEPIVKQGGAPLMGLLGMMAKAYGDDMPSAVAEIAKKNPEAVQAGWMIANNVNPDAAKAIVDNIARRNDPNYKAMIPPRNASEPVVQQVLGDALMKFPPQQRDAIVHATDALYEARNKTPERFVPDDYKKALSEVLGESERGGAKFGGVVAQSGGIFSSGNRIVLPPNVRQDAWKGLLDSLTPQDMAEAGLTLPVFADGRAMSLTKAVNGKLVQAGVGRYLVSLGDPSVQGQEKWVMAAMPSREEPLALADEGPAQAPKVERPKDDGGMRPDRMLRSLLQGAGIVGADPAEFDTASLPPLALLPRQAFVLDFSRLEPILRRRRPDAFN